MFSYYKYPQGLYRRIHHALLQYVENMEMMSMTTMMVMTMSAGTRKRELAPSLDLYTKILLQAIPPEHR